VGSGFRTFTAGEVLTASNVQNYLMDQSVMVFGGSAARSSAIGTANFEEGMVSYLTDTDKVEAYNGTDWVSVAPTTSQGLTLINTTSFSGVSSQVVPDVFSANYKSYKVIIELSQSGVSNILFRLRTAGGSSAATAYDYMNIVGVGGSITSTGSAGNTSFFATGSAASGPGWCEMILHRPFEAATTYFQSLWFTNVFATGMTSGFHQTATSYPSFEILPTTGNFTGSVKTYGLNQ
jgi:hypothetical protein